MLKFIKNSLLALAGLSLSVNLQASEPLSFRIQNAILGLFAKKPQRETTLENYIELRQEYGMLVPKIKAACVTASALNSGISLIASGVLAFSSIKTIKDDKISPYFYAGIATILASAITIICLNKTMNAFVIDHQDRFALKLLQCQKCIQMAGETVDDMRKQVNTRAINFCSTEERLSIQNTTKKSDCGCCHDTNYDKPQLDKPRFRGHLAMFDALEKMTHLHASLPQHTDDNDFANMKDPDHRFTQFKEEGSLGFSNLIPQYILTKVRKKFPELKCMPRILANANYNDECSAYLGPRNFIAIKDETIKTVQKTNVIEYLYTILLHEHTHALQNQILRGLINYDWKLTSLLNLSPAKEHHADRESVLRGTDSTSFTYDNKDHNSESVKLGYFSGEEFRELIAKVSAHQNAVFLNKEQNNLLKKTYSQLNRTPLI